MPKPDRPAMPRCDLGVTGKRVRRALPAISPPPTFRTALKQAVSYQLSAVSLQGDESDRLP
ncbi:MAG: hypothetical protein ACRDJE_20565 [Dehalococcoidia bacterium]